jgi:hypothetical protein
MGHLLVVVGQTFTPDFPSIDDAESLIQLLAEVYVPQRSNDPQPFFTNGPEDLITGVTLVFDEFAPGRWDARDQIEATSSIPRLKFVLNQSDDTCSHINTYLDTEVTSKSLIASVRAAMRDFRPVAGLWSRTPRKINLREFVENLGYVLVLQPSEAKRRVSRATQRLFLQRILEYALTSMIRTTDAYSFFLTRSPNSSVSISDRRPLRRTVEGALFSPLHADTSRPREDLRRGRNGGHHRQLRQPELSRAPG